MIFGKSKTQLPDAADALPGRDTRQLAVGDRHLVLGNPIETDPPEGFEVVVVGLGCFWGEEKTFWEVPGVWSTSVGYAGGVTPNPTYEEVCTGRTGHAEVVRIIFDPAEGDVPAAPAGVLGEPRPDAGHAPGQRPRHRSTARSSSRRRPSSRRWPRSRASTTRRR